MRFETFASTKLNIFERPALILMSSFPRGRTISCAALLDAFGTMDIGFFMTPSWISYVSESTTRTLSNSFSRPVIWRKMRMRKRRFIFYGRWRRWERRIGSSCQGSRRSLLRLEVYFQIMFRRILFDIVMHSTALPFYSFLFILLAAPPRNLLFTMGHIPVYDAYSLHYMMLQFAANRYYVRDDNKLGSHPVPSIRVSIRKMLGYPLLWTIYLKIHLLYQVFYLLGCLIIA